MSMVVGVDVGIQGTKALLVDIEKGIIDSAYTGYAQILPELYGLSSTLMFG